MISTDGSVTYLDQNTIVETANRSAHNIYTDSKSLRAPLPNVSIGCIVEYEIAIKDHSSFFSAGVAGRYVRFVWSNVLPVKEFPPATDPHVVILPSVEYSSGKSWQDIARSYKQIVDEQLMGFESEAKKISLSLVAATDERKQKIHKLLHYIHKHVRYTGLELGEKSLVPENPPNVLKRGYGDCKDKATLLVGLLRAQGMEAYVALLDVGPGLDALVWASLITLSSMFLGMSRFGSIRVASMQELTRCHM